MKALVASPGAEGKVDLVDVDEPEARPNQVLVEVMAAWIGYALTCRIREGLGAGGRGNVQRQPNAYHGSAALFALDGDLSAVGGHAVKEAAKR